MACHRSRSLGVGARISRRYRSLASICHCSRNRSFASHSPPSPPQPHIGLTQFLRKFTALPCAFHLGFGLGLTLDFMGLFIFFPEQVLSDPFYNTVRDGEGLKAFLTVLWGFFNNIGGH